jgi:hypothetical protein
MRFHWLMETHGHAGNGARSAWHADAFPRFPTPRRGVRTETQLARTGGNPRAWCDSRDCRLDRGRNPWLDGGQLIHPVCRQEKSSGNELG